jgi:hypothetical protein
MKTLLGVVINMGVHTMSDITDYFSQAWVNKMPFFLDVFPRDEFCSCSGTYILPKLRKKVN